MKRRDFVSLILVAAATTAFAVGCNPSASDNKPVRGGGGDSHNHAHGDGHDHHDGDAPTYTDELKGKVKAAAAAGKEFFFQLYGAPVDKGGWGPDASVGVNGLVLNGLLRTYEPASPKDERVLKTLDSLIAKQERDGAWVSPQFGEAVYETAAVLRALVEAARLDADFKAREDVVGAIRRGRDYLLLAQIDENPEFEGDPAVTKDDPELGSMYGGWGYGRKHKPGRATGANLSTSLFAGDALDAAASVIGDDDGKVAAAREKTLNFLRHVHNLHEGGGQPYNTEAVNPHWDDEPEASPGNDGGAMYSPGTSKAGTTEGRGGIRITKSYGSMTYAMLRLYHMAGVAKSDFRIAKTIEWVTRSENFTFDHNPGFVADGSAEFQGHFYYLWTAAYTLNLHFGSQLVVEDSRGEKHNWKAEIAKKLVALQGDGGMWINPKAERWQEGNPIIAGAYALIAAGALK